MGPAVRLGDMISPLSGSQLVCERVGLHGSVVLALHGQCSTDLCETLCSNL